MTTILTRANANNVILYNIVDFGHVKINKKKIIT